jgi:hypothetical protein
MSATLQRSTPYKTDCVGFALEQLADALVASGVPELPFGLGDLYIQTKDARLVVLGDVVNDVQAAILDDVAPAWHTGDCTLARGSREYDLKARQFGVSTLFLALYFLDTINNPDRNTVVIADDAENTTALFAKVKLFYDNLPTNRRPRTRYSTKTELDLADLRSTFRVLTAGKGGAGRSRTIHNLHISELAFWPDADVVLTGLLQAVPAGGNVTIESTANGRGGKGEAFYREWQAAVRGENGYRPRFTPWYAHKEYSIEPDPAFVPITGPEDDPLVRRFGDEMALMQRHRLTLGQIAWRREKMLEPGMGAQFRQEYPATADEAFLASGATFFNDFDDQVGGRHVVAASDVPAWWHFAGGFDYGKSAPACFLLGVWNPAEICRVLTEVYMPGEESDQADAIVGALKRFGLWDNTTGSSRCVIYSDPSIFPATDPKKRIGRPIVQTFWDKGLQTVPAQNNRLATNSNLRTYLSHDKILIHAECRNLIRTLPTMIVDPNDAEDFDHRPGIEDHAVDALRYLLMHRDIRPTETVSRLPDTAPRWAKEAAHRARGPRY